MGDAVKIMYVCDCCADECPENCGHYDPAEVRRSPSGWLCEVCYDEEREEDAPVFSDLPVAAPPEPTDAEVEAAARAICAEQSAFMGEPACWAVKGADGCELPWPNPGCNEPGCHAVASAALIAARKARA